MMQKLKAVRFFGAQIFVALTVLSYQIQAYAEHATEVRARPTKHVLMAKNDSYEKKGFERPTQDIINTLQNTPSFNTLLDSLSQAYDLDKTLKNRGPFTLFAPNDKAFKKIPGDDLQSLTANKKKLKQVLSYHVVEGQLSLKGVSMMKSIKTMEGHELKISQKGNDIKVDKATIIRADIPCSNGVIHVIDSVVMPPLSK